MIQQGIFIRDFISLDHLYLNEYGELAGNSLLPILNVGGVSSAKIEEVKNTALAQIRRYKNKIWIIEGFSKCKVRVVDSDIQWNISPLKKFDEGMFDPNVPGNLVGYMQKDVEIETSLFKAVIPGINLKITAVEEINSVNTNVDYFSYVGREIEKNIETILKVIEDHAIIEVSLDWYQSGAYQVGTDYSYANYVRIFVNEADSIVYQGFASKIETPTSYSANVISDHLNDSYLFRTSDMNLSLNLIEMGEYSIKFDFDGHFKKTSRRIKTMNFNELPDPDFLIDYYGNRINQNISMIKMSEGLLSGVIRYI